MDTEKLFELIDKFDSSGLLSLKYRTEEDNIILKKQRTPTLAIQPSSHPSSSTVESEEKSSQEDKNEGDFITAPVIGTFYRSPSPDSPPFVEENAIVKSGDIICIIEAMKVMNTLEAEFDLQISKIMVENGDTVDFGTQLFEVRRI